MNRFSSFFCLFLLLSLQLLAQFQTVDYAVGPVPSSAAMATSVYTQTRLGADKGNPECSQHDVA